MGLFPLDFRGLLLLAPSGGCRPRLHSHSAKGPDAQAVISFWELPSACFDHKFQKMLVKTKDTQKSVHRSRMMETLEEFFSRLHPDAGSVSKLGMDTHEQMCSSQSIFMWLLMMFPGALARAIFAGTAQWRVTPPVDALCLRHLSICSAGMCLELLPSDCVCSWSSRTSNMGGVMPPHCDRISPVQSTG